MPFVSTSVTIKANVAYCGSIHQAALRVGRRMVRVAPSVGARTADREDVRQMPVADASWIEVRNHAAWARVGRAISAALASGGPDGGVRLLRPQTQRRLIAPAIGQAPVLARRRRSRDVRFLRPQTRGRWVARGVG